MPPKKKITALLMFQRDFREKSSLYSKCSMGDMKLIRAAQDAWLNLPPSQRELWETKASKENKAVEHREGDTWKRDCNGELLAEVRNREELREKWRQQSTDHAISLIESLPSNHLFQHDFVLAYVNNFICDKTADGRTIYLPAEISLVRYNFTDGEKEIYSCMPDVSGKDRFPLGYRSACMISKDDEHSIPLTHNIDANKDYGNICCSIVKICRKSSSAGDNAVLPIYAIEMQIQDVQLALIDIWNQGRTFMRLSKNPWLPRDLDSVCAPDSKVFIMDDIVKIIMLKRCNINLHLMEVDNDFWKVTNFDSMSSDMACPMHNQLYEEVRCSLYKARRCFWQMANGFHKYFNFDSICQLLPEPSQEKCYVTQQVDWLISNSSANSGGPVNRRRDGIGRGRGCNMSFDKNDGFVGRHNNESGKLNRPNGFGDNDATIQFRDIRLDEPDYVLPKSSSSSLSSSSSSSSSTLLVKKWNISTNSYQENTPPSTPFKPFIKTNDSGHMGRRREFVFPLPSITQAHFPGINGHDERREEIKKFDTVSVTEGRGRGKADVSNLRQRTLPSLD